MTHPLFHAQSSARIFRGKPSDYIELHQWMDESKRAFCDFRHRAHRHHAEGIFEGEEKFGLELTNSDGKTVPVRYVLEQHVLEDCGRIPTLEDWLSLLPRKPWMARATRVGGGTRALPDTEHANAPSDTSDDRSGTSP